MVAYSTPKGWKKSNTAETVTFTKDVGSKYCVISLCKSIDATADAKQNFDKTWQIMAKTNLGASAAQMQPGSTDKGWETKIGAAPFEKEGLTGTAILISSSNNNKLVNILIITNTDAYQKEMEAFLESIDLKELVKTNTTNKPATTTNLASNSNSIKPEVWMVNKYSITKRRYSVQWLTIYPNGDCINYIPENGLLGFSKATDDKDQYQFWGTKKDKGKEIQIDFGNGTQMRFGKISSTEMSYPPESKTTIYKKCKSVDGLKLEGQWSSGGINGDPNWYNISGFSDGIIAFRKDGTFNNKGVHTKKGDKPSEIVYKEFGSGTYYIKDYTLVLNYSDGTAFNMAFTGFKNTDPQTNNEIVFINEVPFYKNLKK